MLVGTPESAQELHHKSGRTLMSPQEREIAWCSPNELEMMPDSPALAPEKSPIPHHKQQVGGLPLGNSSDSQRHPSPVYGNTNFSTRK